MASTEKDQVGMGPSLGFMPSSKEPLAAHSKGQTANQKSLNAQCQPQSEPPVFYSAVQFSCVSARRKWDISSIRADCVTHVLCSASIVSEDKVVATSDDVSQSRDGGQFLHDCLRACQELRRSRPGIKVVLSIGTCSLEQFPMFSTIMADPARRDCFVDYVRGLIDLYSLDGIDIAWDDVDSLPESNNFLILLATLRSSLPQPEFLLTASLSPKTRVDFRAVANIVDLLNLKAFDFASPSSIDRVSHASQAFPSYSPDTVGAMSCKYICLELLRRGVPSRKLMLAVPAFGREHTGASRMGEHYPHSKRMIPYADLAHKLRLSEIDNDDDAGACTTTRYRPGSLVSFENPWSVHHKATLVKDLELAGLIVWESLHDSESERKSIVKAAYLELRPDRVGGF